MPIRPASALRQLERLRTLFKRTDTERKLALLRPLSRARLTNSGQLWRLHELLCFWRAYPDDPRLLRVVEQFLARFDQRADLRRTRDAMVNSGIAGTPIVYPFSLLTAQWLAARWGDRLSIEWDSVEQEERLAQTLILLVLPAEVPGLDASPLPARDWLERLREPGRGDATFLVTRLESLDAPPLARERMYEALELRLRLEPGPDTPARTNARATVGRVAFQRTPLRSGRPELRLEARRPPESIRDVSVREGARVIDLARAAMVTRERDLDAFAWADPRDVRMAECGEGLQFAILGVRPERRFLLESVYGLLTLKNGVPIGYALGSGLLQFSEVAYNVFETFRGAEAAHVFGRLLAIIRALFSSETFTIDPYQLGDGNDEGLQSGAWWFYYKLGFRPRHPAAMALASREEARVRRDPSYRTSSRTLRQVVRHRLFLELADGPPAAGEPLDLSRIGLRVSSHVTARFGLDRGAAARRCADDAARWLGVPDWRRLPANERGAWERWAPLVALLPGVRAWTSVERRALADVIRAKGGRRETEFVARFDHHERLRAAILTLGRPPAGGRRDLTG